MFSILNRALSWAITSFGNKFCLKKRSGLIKASDNRFYVKFMQLEIGLLIHVSDAYTWLQEPGYDNSIQAHREEWGELSGVEDTSKSDQTGTCLPLDCPFLVKFPEQGANLSALLPKQRYNI